MFLINDLTALFAAAESNRVDVSSLLTAKLQECWGSVQHGEFQRRVDDDPPGLGYSLDCSAEPIRGSGVGQSAQEAITGGLGRALGLVGSHFNAAKVEEILVKEYPWFFLARVTVLPYRFEGQYESLPIQENADDTIVTVPGPQRKSSTSPQQRRR